MTQSVDPLFGEYGGLLGGHPITLPSGLPPGIAGANALGQGTVAAAQRAIQAAALAAEDTSSDYQTSSVTGLPIPQIQQPLDNLLPFFNEIPTGYHGRIGVKESWDLEEPATIRRTWSGKAIVLAPPYAKKQRLSWSGDGMAIAETPAFDAASVGMPVTVFCIHPTTAYIEIGNVDVTLFHDCVLSGGVYATAYTTGQRIAVLRKGRLVKLAGGPVDDVVMVRYRPILYCILTKWSSTYDQRTALVTWRAEFTEQ